MGDVNKKFNAVLREMKRAHRARFESILALNVAESASQLKAVQTVNARILSELAAHRDEAIELIEKDPRQMFSAALFDPSKAMFGRLGETEKMAPATLLDKAMEMLTDPKTSLNTRIHLQMNMMYRLNTKLSHRQTDEMLAKADELRGKVFPKSAYADRSRTRHEETTLVSHLGIARGPLKLKATAHEHAAAVYNMRPNTSSEFFIKATQTHAMPFVAGISGHTGSILFNAMLIADIEGEALQEYAMAAFAYLTNGGNHSFHEVMSAARLAGVEYKDGDYASAIPPSMVGVFRSVTEEHPAAMPETLAMSV